MTDAETKLRAAIAQAGGLFSRAGLAVRWGVSKAYVSEVTARADFPEPVVIDGKEYWTGASADTWRGTPRKPGRPPTTARTHDPIRSSHT